MERLGIFFEDTMMTKRHFNLTWLAICLSGWLGCQVGSACNVPVFRYALEQWPSDSFVAVVFHWEPFTAEQQALLEALNQQGRANSANLQVCDVDVSKAMAAPFQTLWAAQSQPTLPWLVVRYPALAGLASSVWAGPLATAPVQTFSDSPVRRELTRCLTKGETAVWLLLESGDKAADDALAQTVEGESRKLEQTLKLPETTAADPAIHESLPLKIAFSTVRLSRTDPAERTLVAQLLNWDPNLSKLTKPMLFPIYGRGRFLPPAVGGEIRGDVIASIAQILAGPCSCEIKEMNAGCDLLIAANWDALFVGQELKSEQLPPLVGLSQFAAAASNSPAAGRQPPVPPATLGHTAPDHLVRNVVIALGLGVIFLGGATLALKIRHRQSLR